MKIKFISILCTVLVFASCASQSGSRGVASDTTGNPIGAKDELFMAIRDKKTGKSCEIQASSGSAKCMIGDYGVSLAEIGEYVAVEGRAAEKMFQAEIHKPGGREGTVLSISSAPTDWEFEELGGHHSHIEIIFIKRVLKE